MEYGIVAGASFISALIIMTFYHRIRLGSYHSIADEILAKAEHDRIILYNKEELNLKNKQLEYQQDVEKKFHAERKKIYDAEERVRLREDTLEERALSFDKKLHAFEKKEAQLATQKEAIIAREKKLVDREAEIDASIETLAKLSTAEARTIVLEKVKEQTKRDAAAVTRRIICDAREHSEREAVKVITTAIGRTAVPCVTESTVSIVQLPNDEMKGRIIGKEGRNIRALEKATGVNFIVDETPNAIVISSFDAVRREIAKVALIDLITDGRIHPSRIEDAVIKAQQAVERKIREYGEDAALRSGALNLAPELINIIGSLKFRSSFGQNILDHSVEVSHIMGALAAELGLNIALAKRIGLLHDIGKTASYENDGSHAILGAEIAKKYKEHESVVEGIRSHHEEALPTTLEGSLCSAADSISAARPGARVEAVDYYLKRLKNLEDIAYQFPGVEKAYAMHAGREIRVMLIPEMVDDDGSVNIARDLAQKIQNELSYPGKIKVTVIREKRSIEYAL